MADLANITRRLFLSRAPAVAAVGALTAAANPAVASEPENTDFITPERASFKLAELMNQENPGFWRILINRKNGYVMIFQDRSPEYQSASGVMMDLRSNLA